MLIALAILIVLGLSGLRVAQEYQRGVIFRLGRYVGLRGPGLYWIIPLQIERSVTADIRTRTVSAEYSGEDDRRFRPKVTGDSAGSALLWFFTLVGHDQSTFGPSPGLRVR